MSKTLKPDLGTTSKGSAKRDSPVRTSSEYIIRSDNLGRDKYLDQRLPIAEYADIILGRVVWGWQAV